MLRRKYSYKDTNRPLTIRKRYSYMPSLQDNNYIKNTINPHSNNLRPILNYFQRAKSFVNNLPTDEDISMQLYDEIDNDGEESDEIDCLEENDSDDYMNINEDNYATDSEDSGSQDEIFEERNIIDDALDPSKLQETSGDFSPYFDNITTALLFCWIQKHNICKYITI